MPIVELSTELRYRTNWRLLKNVPIFIAHTTANVSGTSVNINVPAGTQNGDLLVLQAASRNGVPNAPAGWSTIISGDASSDEEDRVYAKMAASEPAYYTVTFSGGQWALILATFRFAKNDVADSSWHAGGLEEAPALTCPEYSLYLGFAFSAFTSVNFTSFMGLTLVASHTQGGDAKVMMGYKVIINEGIYGPFQVLNTGAAYDGYGSACFRS